MSRRALLDAAEAEANTARHVASGTGEPLVEMLDAVRLTLAAALEPDERLGEADPGHWCRVELFGHAVRYGLVQDVDLYGRRWLGLAEPEVSGYYERYYDDGVSPDVQTIPARGKTYHPNAVYALEEVGEDAVRAAIRASHGLREEPTSPPAETPQVPHDRFVPAGSGHGGPVAADESDIPF